MNNDLAFILYSHSSLEWMLEPFAAEQKEYFPIEVIKYIYTDYLYDVQEYDERVSKYPSLEDYCPFDYSNSWPYTTRLHSLLKDLKDEFVLIHHEDHIFFQNCDLNMFDHYFKTIKENPEIDSIKLMRGGLSRKEPVKFAEGLYETQDDNFYFYCVQPTIWRKSRLLEVLKANIECSIYELEEKGSEYMRKNNFKCLFAWSPNDVKRGLYHWDNQFYPFIATALNKGKWNDTEYPMEIENFKRSYNLK